MRDKEHKNKLLTDISITLWIFAEQKLVRPLHRTSIRTFCIHVVVSHKSNVVMEFEISENYWLPIRFHFRQPPVVHHPSLVLYRCVGPFTKLAESGNSANKQIVCIFFPFFFHSHSRPSPLWTTFEDVSSVRLYIRTIHIRIIQTLLSHYAPVNLSAVFPAAHLLYFIFILIFIFLNLHNNSVRFFFLLRKNTVANWGFLYAFRALPMK